jgi:hypothetical protein
MYRVAIILALVVTATPAAARDYVPVYGPKHGVMGEGFKHTIEKDGTWRIVTEYRTRDPLVALDVGLYRAAELAREQGKRYVQVLNGYAMGGYGSSNGFVYAIGSDSPAPPASCKAKRCYTADVAKVLDALSGPTGRTPGVAKPTFADEFGRPVTIDGYGIGAVSWKQR